jgi:drug/metabolite transporter (DMT)-like permease
MAVREVSDNKIRQRMFANGYLLVQTMLWGMSFLVMKDITSSMTAVSYLAVRFILAALVLLPFYIGKLRSAFSAGFMKASLVLGGLLFVSMMLQVVGLSYTSVTNSSFITSTTVILVPVAERFIFKKKIRPMIWAGCFFGLAGILILSGNLSFQVNIGDLLTLLCAVGFTLQIIYSAKYAAEFPADTLGVSQLAVSALLFTATWAFFGFDVGTFKTAFIAGILYTAVINTSAGFVGQIVAMKYTLPTVAALIYALEPIFATFFAVLIPDSSGHCEALTARAVIGAAAITAGAALALFSSAASLKKGLDRDYA